MMCGLIVLEDKELGYSVEVAFGNKELQSVKVIETYAILFIYEDGTSEKSNFFKIVPKCISLN